MAQEEVDDLDDRLARDAERSRRAVYAVAVVQFDNEAGPIVECVYPDGVISDHLRYVISTQVHILLFIYHINLITTYLPN